MYFKNKKKGFQRGDKGIRILLVSTEKNVNSSLFIKKNLLSWIK